MILPYAIRLLCLSLACFFLVHTALALAAWSLSPVAVRAAQRLQPRRATQLLLLLRLGPTALALLVVLGLCAPSFLWLEPVATAERVGLACIFAALLGAIAWANSLARALRATFASLRFTRQCRRLGQESRLPGEAASVLLLEDNSPVLALAGVLRSRLVISRRILQTLSAEQLDAALRHEQAHRVSRDNLKRLLLLLAPNVLPFTRGFASLERAWARFAEWAADDRATLGDARRSVSLASALVQVARLGVPQPLAPFLMALVANDSDLAARVDRLLRAEPLQERPRRGISALLAGAALLATGLYALAIFHPAILYSVHNLLERLIR